MPQTHPLLDNRVFAALMTVVGAVWLVGLPVDVMDNDAAQYAHLARQMLASGEYLQIKNRNWEYLDKPPLHLWLSALSYAVFGVGVVAYKLPAVVMAAVGVVSTGGLARVYYTEAVARSAALMVASCQALFLITNDVRTDTVLLGATALALWQLAEFERNGSKRAFILMCLGVSGAMQTKGPIGLMVPALALISDAALKRQWRRLVRPAWLLAAVLVLLSLAPMTWGLWKQHGETGVRFYFWTQSFGRITGESIWKDDTTPLFFTHTFIWSFLPWSLLAVPAWFSRVRTIFRAKGHIDNAAEAFTVGAFTLAFVAFSLSRYKLPHYIFVLFPLAAIITAAWLDQMLGAPNKLMRVLQLTQLAAATAPLILLGMFAVWAFPMESVVLWAVVAVLVGAGALSLRSPEPFWRLMGAPLGCMLAFNVVLAGHGFPSALQYQAGMAAARMLLRSEIPLDRLYAMDGTLAYSMDFYLHKPMREVAVENLPELTREGPVWLFTTENGVNKTRDAGYPVTVVQTFMDHKVSRLNGPFLNPQTRQSTLQPRHLLRVDAR